MRYIGLDPYRNTVVQIDGNKSQYINVRSFGATGLDRYFTGTVSGVNSSGTSIYFNGISDFYEYEKDYFIVGRRVTAFFCFPYCSLHKCMFIEKAERVVYFLNYWRIL